MLARRQFICAAKSRSADIFSAAEVCFKSFSSYTQGRESVMKRVERFRMNTLCSVKERSNMVEAHALKLALLGLACSKREPKVGRPGDRSASLGKAAQPQCRPPDKFLRREQNQRNPASQAQEEIVDQTHVVVKRSPIYTQISG